jgi:hypothetical protein
MHEKESKSHPDGHGVERLSYTSGGFVLSSYVDCTWFFFSNRSRGQTETASSDNPWTVSSMEHIRAGET